MSLLRLRFWFNTISSSFFLFTIQQIILTSMIKINKMRATTTIPSMDLNDKIPVAASAAAISLGVVMVGFILGDVGGVAEGTFFGVVVVCAVVFWVVELSVGITLGLNVGITVG
jgi:hypothetical protein